MPKTEVDFHGMLGKPFIKTVYECICNENEGELEFDGYYYVFDENDDTHRRYTDRKLPRIEFMDVKIISDEPPRITYVSSSSSFINLIEPFSNSFCSVTPINEPIKQLHYDILSNNTYKIEIYRRELIQDTSSFPLIEDGDDEMECICFFPTHRQRIYFRILATNPPFTEIAEFMRAEAVGLKS